MIVNRNLLDTTLENVKRRVWRKYIQMLGCKGLKLTAGKKVCFMYLHWPKSTSLNVIHLYTVQTIAQVSMLLAHWRHKHQRRPQMNTLDWKGQVEISEHTNYFFEERSRNFYISSFKKINWNMTHLFLWSRICSSLKFHENVSMSLHLFSVIFVKYNWFRTIIGFEAGFVGHILSGFWAKSPRHLVTLTWVFFENCWGKVKNR